MLALEGNWSVTEGDMFTGECMKLEIEMEAEREDRQQVMRLFSPRLATPDSRAAVLIYTA